MKNFLFFVCIVIIFSCAAPKDRYDLIKEKQIKELKLGNIRDTTFLNFVFGSSSEQVDDHFLKLVNDGSITVNYKNEYELDIPMDLVPAKANFSVDYINDSLCHVSLKIDANTISEAELIQLKMASLLKEKYGTPLIVESILNKSGKDYVFIVGNQQIEVRYPFIDMVIINYSDFRMDERKSKINQEKRDNEREANNKELIKNF